MSRAIGDWEYKHPNFQEYLSNANKKTKKKPPINKKAEALLYKKAPYRNIEDSKKHQVTSFPDIEKVRIQPDLDYILVACDGIWDCFSNEQVTKFVKTCRQKGPTTGLATGVASGLQKSKTLKSEKPRVPLDDGKSLALKPTKHQSEPLRRVKKPGEVSFIIEEKMDEGIAKGDINDSDGIGTDNMTCIII